jgi:two-component system, OmpR family, alkaline phosphatase synthesis response regulator PhoP
MMVNKSRVRAAGRAAHWLADLDTFEVEFLILNTRYDHALIDAVRGQPAWKIEREDGDTILFVRSAVASQTNGSQHAAAHVWDRAVTMAHTILVVDDETRIVTLVRDYLERAGYRVLTAADGETALATVRAQRPDLVVLDLMLPGVDSLDVCRRLRRESGVPIIMLTARVEETDRIVGLELGADDYVTKPFSPRELVARVRATLRRANGEVGPPMVVRAGDVELNTTTLVATVAGKVLDLTSTEFQLLAALARQPGRILTRDQLLEAVHGVVFDGYDRSIDSHIKNIRRKIEPDPRTPRYIQTVYGVGYRFIE